MRSLGLSVLCLIFPVLSWGASPPNWCERILSAPTFDLRQAFFDEALSGRNKASLALRDGEGDYIAPVVQSLSENDWNAKILDPTGEHADGVMRAALEAYRKGMIGLETIATLSQRWSAARDFSRPIKLKALPLLSPNGELSQHAKEFFSDRNIDYPIPGLPDHLQRIGLNDTQLPGFREALLRLPESERNVFVVDTDWDNEPWSCNVICNIHIWRMMMPRRIGAFGRDGGGFILVIPSFGVLQSYLDARFGTDAAQLFPRVGLASPNKVYFSIAAGGRIFGLNFPDLPPLTSVDGVVLARLFFSWHDDYHAYLASSFPKLYRKLLPRILMVLEDGRNEGKISRPRLKKLRQKILDLELPTIRESLNDRSLAMLIKTDFSLEEIALIRRDLETNYGLYEKIGLNVQELLNQLP